MAFFVVILLVSITIPPNLQVNGVTLTSKSNYGQISTANTNSVAKAELLSQVPQESSVASNLDQLPQQSGVICNYGQCNQQSFQNSFVDQQPPPPPQLGESAVMMESVLRPGEYLPNCGCVPRGACSREIGQYTRLVGQYSDVVCGVNFERCCFDGPCPGVLDEFVRAAPCVPKELCLRPYGVLPTDVRDFGIIGPCPGQGAVRCISVDDATLLQFQAAVAAIEASSHRYVVNEEEEEAVPEQIIVPIIPPKPAPPPAVPAVTYVSSYEQPKPIAPIPQLPSLTSSDIATLIAQAQRSKIGPSSAAQTMTSYTSGGDTTGQITSVVSGGQKISPPAATVPIVTPVTSVIAPPALHFVGTPQTGFNCRATGCYTPWAYRNYFGTGFPYGGLGYGYRKSFHFSKGFGYGLF